jgi:hypothetical protein
MDRDRDPCEVASGRMKIRYAFVSLVTKLMFVSLFLSGSATASIDTLDSLVTAPKGGKPIIDLRYRFELVDQGGFARDAKATTLRVRLGYETGEYKGFSILGELDATEALGVERFNSTINGKTQFPVIADPDSFRINRINLRFTGIPGTQLKVGRQRIIFDDSRFIGNVGWRQNEQTNDSVLLSNSSLPDTKIAYVYVWRTNRIFGDESPVGNFDSDSHLVNATYTGFEPFKITAFGYLVDLNDASGLSSATYGFRVSGNIKVNDEISFLFSGSYAHQSDYGNNPASYDEDYYALEGGATWRGFLAKAGYEVLQGDGVNSFKIPLATLHKFQGFADVFLTTPGAGIEDLYVVGQYTSNGGFLPKGIKAAVTYHDFEGENNSLDMGYEIDALIAVSFLERFTFCVKHAHYEGNGFAADRDKFWLSLEFKY